MWALAEHVRRIERQEWQEKFGREFTGELEGRRIRFAWHWRVMGHVCRGDLQSGHGQCIQLGQMAWCWVQSPKGER